MNSFHHDLSWHEKLGMVAALVGLGFTFVMMGVVYKFYEIKEQELHPNS